MYIIKPSQKLVASPKHIVVKVMLDHLVDDDSIWEPDTLLTYIEKTGSVIMYMGEVLDAGKEAKEMGIKNGDIIMFSSFSGIHASTEGDIVKVIPTTDAMVRINKFESHKELDVNDIEPLNDRILIEVLDNNIEEEQDENEFVETDIDKEDPRITSVTYGKVLKVAEKAHNIVEVGDVVLIEHFVGEIIRPATVDGPELRAMSDMYVTAIVKKD